MAHQAAAYSGLLLAPPPSARLSHHHLHQAAAASQCKAGPGPGDWQHHQTSHLDTATAAAYAATYPTMAGKCYKLNFIKCITENLFNIIIIINVNCLHKWSITFRSWYIGCQYKPYPISSNKNILINMVFPFSIRIH